MEKKRPLKCPECGAEGDFPPGGPVIMDIESYRARCKVSPQSNHFDCPALRAEIDRMNRLRPRYSGQ